MKIHTIVDGSYMCFTEYSIFSSYGKTASPLKTEREQVAFIQGLATRFFSAINKLPKGGRVVFCMDSPSWRKSIQTEGGGYKHSREDDKGNKGTMDRETKEIFYALIKEFMGLLKKIDIDVSVVMGAEGDDLLYTWSEYFKSKGESSIMVTGDRDLVQTLRGGDSWNVVWTNKSNSNKLYAVDTWTEDWLYETDKSTDVFNFMVREQDEMTKMLKESDVKIEFAVPQAHVLKKILIGDDGDDVPAVWSIKKGDKSVRVTNKPADKIIEFLLTNFDLRQENCMSMWGNEEFMDVTAGAILRVMGDIDGKEQRQRVKLNLERNAKFVWLNHSVMPESLTNKMKEDVQRSLQECKPDRIKWNKKQLFEGSRFSERVPPKGFDPFAHLMLPDEF